MEYQTHYYGDWLYCLTYSESREHIGAGSNAQTDEMLQLKEVHHSVDGGSDLIHGRVAKSVTESDGQLIRREGGRMGRWSDRQTNETWNETW